jgi:hypothetical protein
MGGQFAWPLPRDMKQDSSNPGDETLHQVLQQWKVAAPLPPRFQEEVWHRIQRVDSQPSAPAWLVYLQRLFAGLVRPSLAASYVTVLLLAGLLAGYWQVRATRAQFEGDLGARYVQMLDPYQKLHH